MVAIPTYLLASILPHLSSRHPSLLDTTTTTTTQRSSSFYSSITGPVIASNFPDPALLHHNGTTYAYSTNTGPIHIPMATSTDNLTFTLLPQHDALPTLAPWEAPGRVWAPDVVALSPTSFLMYYSSATTVSNSRFHCIGAATASHPLGPFTPLPHPLICPDGPTTGGAIDPDGFLDPTTGKRYVVYKIDGNALGNGGSCNNDVAPIRQTPIMLQEVEVGDGVTFVGEARMVLDRDEGDGPLVEAPSLVYSSDGDGDGGWYFLFFASNCFSGGLYATSYAVSREVWGPYVKSGRPLLVTGDVEGVVGPGGLDVGEGGLVGFHSIVQRGSGVKRGEPDGQGPGPLVRGMWAGRVTFEGRQVSFGKQNTGGPV